MFLRIRCRIKRFEVGFVVDYENLISVHRLPFVTVRSVGARRATTVVLTVVRRIGWSYWWAAIALGASL